MLGGGSLAEVRRWLQRRPTIALLPLVRQLFDASSMAQGSTAQKANQTAGFGTCDWCLIPNASQAEQERVFERDQLEAFESARGPAVPSVHVRLQQQEVVGLHRS